MSKQVNLDQDAAQYTNAQASGLNLRG